MDAFLDGKLDVLVSPALIAELTDVLGRGSLSACGGRSLGSVHSSPTRSSDNRRDAPPGSPRTTDADDDYLIALAEAHGVDAVVSGDRHLLDAASSELPVLTPRELADRLRLASAA